MLENYVSYNEIVRTYFPHLESKNCKFLKKCERIFLEVEAKELMKKDCVKQRQTNKIR